MTWSPHFPNHVAAILIVSYTPYFHQVYTFLFPLVHFHLPIIVYCSEDSIKKFFSTMKSTNHCVMRFELWDINLMFDIPDTDLIWKGTVTSSNIFSFNFRRPISSGISSKRWLVYRKYQQNVLQIPRSRCKYVCMFFLFDCCKRFRQI